MSKHWHCWDWFPQPVISYVDSTHFAKWEIHKRYRASIPKWTEMKYISFCIQIIYSPVLVLLLWLYHASFPCFAITDRGACFHFSLDLLYLFGVLGSSSLSQSAFDKRQRPLWTGHWSITVLTHTDRAAFTHTGNLEFPLHLTWMCLDCGRT